MIDFSKAIQVEKVSSEGLVYGFAVVCKQDGQDHYDLQGEHVPEDVMVEGSAEFMSGVRVAKEMHKGAPIGTILFAFPLTSELAKSLDIQTRKTGLLVAMRPNDDVLAKFKSGEYKGFSVGGKAIYEEQS